MAIDRCPAAYLDLRAIDRCLEALGQLACLVLMAIDRYLVCLDREATGHCLVCLVPKGIDRFPVSLALVATGHCLAGLAQAETVQMATGQRGIDPNHRYLACWLLVFQTQIQTPFQCPKCQCQSLWVSQ